MSSNPKCESKRNLALMPVRTRLDAEGQSTSAYVVVFPSSAQVPGDGPDILLTIRRLRESADPVIPVYSISHALQSSGIPATPPPERWVPATLSDRHGRAWIIMCTG